MQFPIGSHVKLSQHTGDDQIDFYYGQVLEVVEYHESASRSIYSFPIPNYTLVAPDAVVIIANEYELEAV